MKRTGGKALLSVAAVALLFSVAACLGLVLEFIEVVREHRLGVDELGRQQEFRLARR